MTFAGLGLIALGTGGIKPCVAAFGGDQFKEHQVNNIVYNFVIILCLSINFRSICSLNSFPSSISPLMLAV